MAPGARRERDPCADVASADWSGDRPGGLLAPSTRRPRIGCTTPPTTGPTERSTAPNGSRRRHRSVRASASSATALRCSTTTARAWCCPRSWRQRSTSASHLASVGYAGSEKPMKHAARVMLTAATTAVDGEQAETGPVIAVLDAALGVDGRLASTPRRAAAPAHDRRGPLVAAGVDRPARSHDVCCAARFRERPRPCPGRRVGRPRGALLPIPRRQPVRRLLRHADRARRGRPRGRARRGGREPSGEPGHRRRGDPGGDRPVLRVDVHPRDHLRRVT